MKEKIRDLLKKRNAIMLSHNYQPPEIQDLADLCGDSLELSIKAAQTDAEVIVFCGVHFMAETASILSPNKTVLLPNEDAGCLMADMIEPEGLQVMIDRLPAMPVVTYVNSTAAVKALSTICCTSANVVDIVNSLDADEVLMTPDRNLALYTAPPMIDSNLQMYIMPERHIRTLFSWLILNAGRKSSNWQMLFAALRA
jgi:quinolinate synthase